MRFFNRPGFRNSSSDHTFDIAKMKLRDRMNAINAMNELKQRTNGSLKIDWLTGHWSTCWQTHWLTDWPTDRPLAYNFKLTDYWLTDWMTLLTDLVTMKKEGLKWSNIININCFCFVLFCSGFCSFFFLQVYRDKSLWWYLATPVSHLGKHSRSNETLQRWPICRTGNK